MQSLEEKLTTKWYRDYSHKLHIQRLQEIKSHASKRIDNSVPKTKDTIAPQKQGKEFLKKEKKKSITKNNQQLLKILTEITAGKRETTTQKILNSTRDAPLMKSLNKTVRKKEARRIDEDNEEMVRRLNDKKPGVSFKKLQEEWSIMNRYRESISKRGYRNESSHLVSRLPPMDELNERSRNGEKGEESLSRTLGAISSPKNRKKIKALSVKQSKEDKKEGREEADKNKEEIEIKEDKVKESLDKEKVNEKRNSNKFEDRNKEGLDKEKVIEKRDSIKVEDKGMNSLDKEKNIEKKDSIKLKSKFRDRVSKKVSEKEVALDYKPDFAEKNEVEPRDVNELEESKVIEVESQLNEESTPTKIVEIKKNIEENSKSDEKIESFDEKSELDESKEVKTIEKEIEDIQKSPTDSVKTPEPPVIPHHEENHKQESPNPIDPPQLNPSNLPDSPSSQKAETPLDKASNSSSSSLKQIENESDPKSEQMVDEPDFKTPAINDDSPALELNP